MDNTFNPRGDLSASLIQPSTFFHRANPIIPSYNPRRRSTVSALSPTKIKKRPCYDWIFSSGTNVHIAIDRSAFKTYTCFNSYVLTVSNQKQIPVRGVGTVELRIRRQPGSKATHLVLLEDVLHVPGWHCNILSDVIFAPLTDFEHIWSEFGVCFYQKNLDTVTPWGYTENFCGQDKIVLASRSAGRSPMMEDKEREVFSISVKWPQSQQDRWALALADAARLEAERHEAAILQHRSKIVIRSASRSNDNSLHHSVSNKVLTKVSIDSQEQARPGLRMLDPNTSMVRRGPSMTSSNLKNNTSSWASLREALSWKKSGEKRMSSSESSQD